MDKKHSKATRPNGVVTHKVSRKLGEIPVPNGTSAIPDDDALADVDDDFADLRDIDFSQYIADKDDNAGSMNSPSSPSVGMMSKTPFKTPVPSEYADDPIEMDSSPSERPIRLRDYLPGVGSSAEPSFAVDDSQKTKVIPKSALHNKAPPNPPPRISYSLSVSPDNAVGAPINEITSKLANMEPPPVGEVAAPAKSKKASQGRRTEPKKRSIRNRKVNGKKKLAPKQDDIPAAGRVEEAAPPKDVEPAKPPANEPSSANEASPVKASPANEAIPKRPLLARMLSVLSEPGSLKWEEPLVGGQQSPLDNDGRSSAHSPSSPSGTPAVQDDTMIPPVDDDGSIYEPSIPASLIEPFEVTEPLEYDKIEDPAPAALKKKQLSPTLRLAPDIVDPSPPRASPSKSPVKETRKRPSPEKKTRGTQKASAPSKRRRVQEPVKKRIVQPRARAKAKSAQVREEIDDAMVTPATGTPELETTGAPGILRMNSKTQVSETGSPVKITLSSGNASPFESRANRMAKLPGLSQNEGAVDSPNRDVSHISRTETPDLQPVFQSRPSRPHMGKAQVDSPHPRAKKVAETGLRKSFNALITPKSTSKPSGVVGMKSAEKSAPTKAPSHVQPVAPTQKPGFEAFRQHILGQLSTIEARQHNDQPSGSGNPDGSGTTPDHKAPMNVVPQHMLGRVLHTITEKTLEYVKSKEKDLDSITEEYQSGVTSFIDRVEKLHEVENSETIKALNKERQSFIESCDDGAKTCEEFMASLEQCSLSTRGPGGLEKWLEQEQEMKKELLEAELGEG